MTDHDRLVLLDQAEQNLTKVRESLNNKANRCGCCGLTVYENMEHHCHIQSLSSAITKVKRIREELASSTTA